MSGQSPLRPSISEALARRLVRPVDAASRARAALHVLDWTACAVAGAAAPAANAMRAALGGEPEEAALFLGALGNILEMDDVDKKALLHPGPVVLPAALAVEATSDSESFLDAIVRGYEAMIRVGRAVGPAHYKYWHNTSTCGPIGGAAAAASLLSLDEQGVTTALELGAAQACGFWQVRHESSSHAKQLHTAHAAQSGLLAARLAQAGFIGVRTIFEGPQGFFAATSGGADPQRVVDFDPDATWAIHDVSFKPWPACRHAHAVIDAALALRMRGVAIDRISSVTVRTYRDAIVFCDRPAPLNALDAKFSLQHSAAVAIVRGGPAIADFGPSAITDPQIANLRRRVSVVADDRYTSLYPAHFSAGVEIVLDDGAAFSADISDALGDPENPVSTQILLEKARSLMTLGGLSAGDAAALIGAALSLGDGASLCAYKSLLKKALRR